MKKPAHYYRQSGAVPFRKEGKKIFVMLITSTKRKHWLVPKGLVEPDMRPNESAAKEALEEAGVTGKISSRMIGKYNYSKWGGTCRVNLYALKVDKVLRNWDEKHFRRRRWFTLEQAASVVNEAGIAKAILQVPAAIKEQF